MSRLSIVLPIKWAPGKIQFGRGHAYWPKTTRLYKIVLAEQLIAHKTDVFLEGPLAVTLHFIRPRPKSAPRREWFTVKPDLDNLESPTLNSMQRLIIGNDAHIVEKHSHKSYGDAWELHILIETLV